MSKDKKPILERTSTLVSLVIVIVVICSAFIRNEYKTDTNSSDVKANKIDIKENAKDINIIKIKQSKRDVQYEILEKAADNSTELLLSLKMLYKRYEVLTNELKNDIQYQRKQSMKDTL